MGWRFGGMRMIDGHRSDWKSAVSSITTALTLDERRGDRAGVVISLGNLGIAYFEMGQYAKALELYRRSQEFAEELGDRAMIARNLGNMAIQRGDLDQAEELYRKSLVISERIGDQKAIANAYHNLGLVADQRGDTDQAEELYRKSLEIKARVAD